MKPVAIVSPWFGKTSTGGAERIAWQTAHRLQDRGYQVEILTTCCKSFFSPWGDNYYAPGLNNEEGLAIRRFAVDPQNFRDFDRANRILLSYKKEQLVFGCPPVSPEIEQIFIRENINSQALLKYLKNQQSKYQTFVFIPYMYGITLQGLPLVSHKALLQPCLHDEAYAYLSITDKIFRLARYILFNSEGEMELARLMYGPGILQRSIFIGTGVETHEVSSEKTTSTFKIPEHPFLLYIGKRDPQKNIDFLVDCFGLYKKRYHGSDLKLVLCGSGNKSYHNPALGIEDHGYVSDSEKQDLLDNSLALVIPSIHESYSRVMMEAWLVKKPVMVHAGCLATADMVRKSGGGLIADSPASWVQGFRLFNKMRNRELLGMGERGYMAACQYSDWERVIDRYEKIFLSMNEKIPPMVSHKPKKSIHQILPNITSGDAISRQAFMIQGYLRSKGYESEIYACHLDSPQKPVHPFTSDSLWDAGGLIYHHSIGSELVGFIKRYQGPKVLVYHNITPEYYFSHDQTFASYLKEGRLALNTLAKQVETGYGDSGYNSNELREAGFKNTGILPIMIEPAFWNIPPDDHVLRNLEGTKTHIIFVGRIAPNKCQHQIIEAFNHYLTLDPEANLHLIGKYGPDDPYYHHVLSLILKYRLHQQVFVTGKIDEHQLHAYYRRANLFWSMSEHEGFGAPLIESMWFDIPVLAYNAAATPETLGDSGVLFSDKKDLNTLSEMAYKIIHDQDYQKKILKKQRRRRIAFLPEKIHPQIDHLINHLENKKPARKKVAFVVQRCGKDVNGGAESLCFKLAQTMKNSWDIEIITTCARDYTTWKNHYSRGKTILEGVRIKRFRVDGTRDIKVFNQISAQLNQNLEESDITQQEAWMVAQGPISKSLLKYLKKNRHKYDVFIFFTYLYASTYFGLPVVAGRSVLVPTAHDEWMIKMKIWDHFFKLPRGFIFLSDGEKRFLLNRFPHVKLSGPVIRTPVSPPSQYSQERFRLKHKIRTPYLLYLGRLDASKGCLELINFFINFYSSNSSERKLVLLGREIIRVPRHPAVMNLGYVDEQEKWDALSGCEWLVNPSAYESLSMVLLEAWSVKRPVLVTEKCSVMVNQCRLSQGGIWYNGYREFEKILLNIKDWEKDQLGEQGYAYVRTHHQEYKTQRQIQESVRRIVGQHEH